VLRGVFQRQQHLPADEAPASGGQDDRQDKHDDRSQFRQVVALVGRVVDLGGAPFRVRQEGDDPFFEAGIAARASATAVT